MFNKDCIHSLIQAVSLEPTDIVLLQLWGEDDMRPLLDAFSMAIAETGATPISYQHARTYYKALFSAFPSESAPFGPTYFETFKPVTVVIDLLAYAPVKPHDDFPSDKLPLYRKYMGDLFHALSDKDKFVQIRIPTVENALDSPLDPQDFETRMLSAYTIDYSQLKQTCQQLTASLSDKTIVEIKTDPLHTLSFNITNRQWISDAGDGDLPAGEIFIAPLEDSACGSLLIPTLYYFETCFDNITLYFLDGKLTHSTDPTFNTYLSQLPPNATTLCEFGIGLNTGVTDIVGYIPLDEKAIGTCHIALGMNNLFGGTNECPFHEDMVFKAALYFDGVLF